MMKIIRTTSSPTKHAHMVKINKIKESTIKKNLKRVKSGVTSGIKTGIQAGIVGMAGLLSSVQNPGGVSVEGTVQAEVKNEVKAEYEVENERQESQER